MKKFLAIVFALIFALSACTVAFAADYECGACQAIFADEKALTAHNNGGCLEQFAACQYCDAKVRIATEDGTKEIENLAKHEAECPKGATTCDKCGASLKNQAAKADHACDTKDVAENVLGKVVDALGKVDWEGLANKVVDAVKGINFDEIIAKIKPIIEKVVDLVKGAAA